MNHFVTFVNRINHVKYNLDYWTVDDVVQIIRTGSMKLYDREYGSYTLRQAIEHIRTLPEKDKRVWKERLLPAVAYNGKFAEVSHTGLIEYSCMTAMDFDHIATPDEMIHLRNRLVKTPCVLMVFVTPYGHGLKALVLHGNTDKDRHVDLYEQLLQKFNVASKDVDCKDISRRHYLSYDPNIWVNPNPVPFHYVPTVNSQVKTVGHHNGKSVSDQSIISIMNSVWKKNNPEYWQEGNRASSIFKLACMMCKWGVDEDLATDYFIKGWVNATMSEKEIQSHVGNAYKAEEQNFATIEFCMYRK